MLNGSGSHDPDGDPLTYFWTQLSGTPVTLNGADTARPSFRAPLTWSSHELVFQLIVSDGNVTDTDTVTVRVAAYVPPPVIYAPSPTLEQLFIPTPHIVRITASYSFNRSESRWRIGGSFLYLNGNFSPPLASVDLQQSSQANWVEIRVRRSSDSLWSRWVRHNLDDVLGTPI